MNNNNKNKRIAVRKKIIYRKSNLSHTLDMQSIPSHNGIPGKFLEKFVGNFSDDEPLIFTFICRNI